MPVDVRPCWHCRHYGGASAFTTSCTAPGQCVVQALPWNGCAFFEREPGADDELGPPAGFRGSGPAAPGWVGVIPVKPASSDLYRVGRHPLLEEPAGV